MEFSDDAKLQAAATLVAARISARGRDGAPMMPGHDREKTLAEELAEVFNEVDTAATLIEGDLPAE